MLLYSPREYDDVKAQGVIEGVNDSEAVHFSTHSGLLQHHWSGSGDGPIASHLKDVRVTVGLENRYLVSIRVSCKSDFFPSGMTVIVMDASYNNQTGQGQRLKIIIFNLLFQLFNRVQTDPHYKPELNLRSGGKTVLI